MPTKKQIEQWGIKFDRFRDANYLINPLRLKNEIKERFTKCKSPGVAEDCLNLYIRDLRAYQTWNNKMKK